MTEEDVNADGGKGRKKLSSKIEKVISSREQYESTENNYDPNFRLPHKLIQIIRPQERITLI